MITLPDNEIIFKFARFINGVWRVLLSGTQLALPDISQWNEIQPVPLHTLDRLNLLTDNKHARHGSSVGVINDVSPVCHCLIHRNPPQPTRNAAESVRNV